MNKGKSPCVRYMSVVSKLRETGPCCPSFFKDIRPKKNQNTEALKVLKFHTNMRVFSSSARVFFFLAGDG